jgi:hypothetical protein
VSAVVVTYQTVIWYNLWAGTDCKGSVSQPRTAKDKTDVSCSSVTSLLSIDHLHKMRYPCHCHSVLSSKWGCSEYFKQRTGCCIIHFYWTFIDMFTLYSRNLFTVETMAVLICIWLHHWSDYIDRHRARQISVFSTYAVGWMSDRLCGSRYGKGFLWDFRFLRHTSWRFMSSGMLRHIDW